MSITKFDLTAVSAEAQVPHEEIAAAKAAGKCGECYACCAGYHEQCKGPKFDWENGDPDHWCVAHQMVTGEGDICGECERLGQRELDLVKRVHPVTNAHFLKYYVDHGHGRHNVPMNVHGRYKLKAIVEHDWAAGISRAQCEVDCMNMGYSLVISVPYITRRWAEMDADYKAWMEEDQRQRLANPHPLTPLVWP